MQIRSHFKSLQGPRFQIRKLLVWCLATYFDAMNVLVSRKNEKKSRWHRDWWENERHFNTRIRAYNTKTVLWKTHSLQMFLALPYVMTSGQEQQTLEGAWWPHILRLSFCSFSFSLSWHKKNRKPISWEARHLPRRSMAAYLGSLERSIMITVPTLIKGHL